MLTGLLGPVLSGSGRSVDTTMTGSIKASSGSRLSVDEGSEFKLPQSILDTLPKELAELDVDWGDGTVETVRPADEPGRVPSHAYAEDSGEGTYRLKLTMKGKNGETTTNSYDITVRNVAPVFHDVEWAVEDGPNGKRIVVRGRIVDPGIKDAHMVTVTWSDGSATEMLVEGGALNRTFTLERPFSAELKPTSILVVDSRDDSSLATAPFNGTRAEPAKPGQRTGPAVVPERRGELRTPDGFTLAFGAGLAFAGVGVRAGAWHRRTLSVDAVLAARMARYEEAANANKAGAEKRLLIPDDWGVAGEPLPAKVTVRPAFADGDDWVVVGRVPYAEAAE
jgi:hypothetical protein